MCVRVVPVLAWMLKLGRHIGSTKVT